MKKFIPLVLGLGAGLLLGGCSNNLNSDKNEAIRLNDFKNSINDFEQSVISTSANTERILNNYKLEIAPTDEKDPQINADSSIKNKIIEDVAESQVEKGEVENYADEFTLYNLSTDIKENCDRYIKLKQDMLDAISETETLLNKVKNNEIILNSEQRMMLNEQAKQLKDLGRDFTRITAQLSHNVDDLHKDVNFMPLKFLVVLNNLIDGNEMMENGLHSFERINQTFYANRLNKFEGKITYRYKKDGEPEVYKEFNLIDGKLEEINADKSGENGDLNADKGDLNTDKNNNLNNDSKDNENKIMPIENNENGSTMLNDIVKKTENAENLDKTNEISENSTNTTDENQANNNQTPNLNENNTALENKNNESNINQNNNENNNAENNQTNNDNNADNNQTNTNGENIVNNTPNLNSNIDTFYPRYSNIDTFYNTARNGYMNNFGYGYGGGYGYNGMYGNGMAAPYGNNYGVDSALNTPNVVPNGENANNENANNNAQNTTENNNENSSSRTNTKKRKGLKKNIDSYKKAGSPSPVARIRTIKNKVKKIFG